jgi:hypothetical protein
MSMVDCPPEYGPAKTVYNRFNRWSAQGIWQSIFEAAAEPAELPERMALDSTHVKAHRCAAGGKGGHRNRGLASPRAGNSKIHGLVDKLCRPWVLILTPVQHRRLHSLAGMCQSARRHRRVAR